MTAIAPTATRALTIVPVRKELASIVTIIKANPARIAARKVNAN